MPNLIMRRRDFLYSASAIALYTSAAVGAPLGLLESDPQKAASLFEPDKLLDLKMVAPPSFNLVDGTVAVAVGEDMPFVLFKGYNKDTWFYAPRWGRLGKNRDGRDAFTITKKVKNDPGGGQTTIGGTLSFMVELVVELPDQATRKKWTELIETLHSLRPSSGAFNFQPLPMAQGIMSKPRQHFLYTSAE